MKNFTFKFSLTFLVILFSCASNNQQDSAQLTAKALQEFQDMKFGLFIHFGPYAKASGVWKNDTLPVSTHAEFLRMAFKIPRLEYHQFASEFNPAAFNANEIVSLAKKAGMKYIVFTAKHCDGFAMFDSDYDNFNIKNGTPYGKDLLKKLSNECKKQGLKLGLYYSHVRDWDEYNSVTAYMNDWDWAKDDSARKSQIYLDAKVKSQLTELLTNYGDIFCLWFDVPYIITREQAEDLYYHVKELQPACLVNSRIGKDFGDYGVLGDNQVPPGVVSGVWETPATMNRSWGFHIADKNWKSSQDLITQLVDLTSKNVNYLLNIGPMSDGSVPEESIQRLNEIGEWTRENGEAIYNTHPSPWYQEMDGFRVTAGNEALYITILNPEIKEITLYNLENEIIKVEGLRNGTKMPFNYKKLEIPEVSVLEISIPGELRNKPLQVIKVFLKGTPVVKDQPTQMSTGNVLLSARLARIVRNEGELQISGIDGTIDIGEWPYFATRNWTHKKDCLEWDFNIIEPGKFEVQVITVSTARDLGSYMKRWNSRYKDPQDFNKLSFSVNNNSVTGVFEAGEPVKSIRSVHRPEFLTRIGIIEIDHPGTFKAFLRAEFINPADPDGLVIYEVRLQKII